MKNKKIITCMLMSLLCFPAQGQVLAMTADSIPSQIQNLGHFSEKSSIIFPDQKNVIPQDCKTQGDETQGASLCKQTYTDGSYSASESHYERAWNELKNQTSITRFDTQGNPAGKQTIRRKTDFTDDAQKIRRKDSFDIVNFPPGKKITREVLIFEYHADGKKFSKISYVQYVQIEDLAFASLLYNVTLRYDEKGFPVRGRAERWKDGQKASEFFRWSREIEGMENFDSAAWKQWEEVAKKASLQEALF